MAGVLWGVLGAANIAIEKVIPAIQRAENGSVVALASRASGRAEEVAGRLGIERAYGSYQELLADPDVDAVYIPLPNHLHAEYTMAAADAGKHVLCEKPLAMTGAEAQQMVDACDRAGVKLMEAFMYRLHPAWQAVVGLVADGAIGPLRAVQSVFAYFNDDPSNIRNQADLGGGALMDVGCYPINVARMLFDAEPIEVHGAIAWDPESGTDVVTSALLRFAHGQATFTVSTRAEPAQHVSVIGERGRIEIPIPYNIPTDIPTRIELVRGGDPPVAPDVEAIEFEPRDQYTAQAEAFGQAILDGTDVPTEPSDAVANMAVIDAIFASQ